MVGNFFLKLFKRSLCPENNQKLCYNFNDIYFFSCKQQRCKTSTVVNICEDENFAIIIKLFQLFVSEQWLFEKKIVNLVDNAYYTL